MADSDELDAPYQAGCHGLIEEVDAAVDQIRERGMRSRAAAWLRRSGIQPDSNPVSFSTGFRCSVTGTTLRTDCQLRQCQYHVDYRWSANCLLAYMHQQGVESLSVDEVSFLYRIPADRVKQKIDEAIVQLRVQAIDQQCEVEQSLSRKFRYIADTRLCIVCESLVTDEIVPRAMQVDGLGVYCGRACREAKPPRIVELEAEKGLAIEQILAWTFKRYRSLSLAEQALQMPRWLMAEASRRYLGQPLEHFFPALQQVQRQRRSALIRRTWHMPKWVDALTRRLKPLVINAQSRFGSATVDIGWLRRRLNDVLENG